MLSAVEHFGLGHYGLDAVDRRLDLAALARVRELVVPGGLLVLTVPFAERAQVDDFQRVYDEAGLSELLAGWDGAHVAARRAGRPPHVAARRAVARAPRRRARDRDVRDVHVVGPHPRLACEPAMGSVYDPAPVHTPGRRAQEA